jgi:predicted amidohydrolase
VRGGTLLNVYTGELYPANVAVAGERIAYVGARDDMVGQRTTTLAADGRILVPGYIDPHVHPAHVDHAVGARPHLLPLGPRRSSPTPCRSGSSAAARAFGSSRTRWRARRSSSTG